MTDISVVAPPGMQAISNGPEVAAALDKRSHATTYHFATTAPISSYLVALGGKRPAAAPLPPHRRGAEQRRLHAENVARLREADGP